MSRTLKQRFCKHDWYLVGVHKKANERLYKCDKCGLFHAIHWGLQLGVYCNISDIDIRDWNFTKIHK